MYLSASARSTNVFRRLLHPKKPPMTHKGPLPEHGCFAFSSPPKPGAIHRLSQCPTKSPSHVLFVLRHVHLLARPSRYNPVDFRCIITIRTAHNCTSHRTPLVHPTVRLSTDVSYCDMIELHGMTHRTFHGNHSVFVRTGSVTLQLRIVQPET